MISEHEKHAIIDCAKRYNLQSILLFGSATHQTGSPNDIITTETATRLHEYLAFRHYANQ